MIDGAGGFLRAAEHSPAAQALFDDDIAELGYVMNASRLWAHEPHIVTGLFGLIMDTAAAHGLDLRERGILVAACASALGDAYCALMWGGRLARAADPDIAAAVLVGDDSLLTDSERVLARWARKVARDPNGTVAADVQELRDAGFDDARIFGITVFVALRVAFSTVNDALGARPDAQLRTALPAAVVDAVTFGRPVAEA
ncbi:carboxymuconolactone decarboxylase family protein [Pseudonocardia sp. GCM10023141]|uniref:carboxymuconolactone decarboxylase family protein n=1 Tax=Pseudonocardia sp. GCM10023141 TaxID=3252653 RepID=UPI003618470F